MPERPPQKPGGKAAAPGATYSLGAHVRAVLQSIEAKQDSIGLPDAAFKSFEKKLGALTGKERRQVTAELIIVLKRFGQQFGPVGVRLISQLTALTIMLASSPKPAKKR